MLRLYQQRIVDAIGRSNAIVKMPTGSGKTIVAAEVVNRQLQRSDGTSALFLVPTQDLVEQQSRVLEEWCPQSTVFQFTGGMSDPQKETESGSVCIVSTPRAFLHLSQRKPDVFGWQEFGIVVFDEVHHVLKDHPYRHAALKIKEWQNCNDQRPGLDASMQILGLSASLTYNVGETEIRKTLQRLCHELGITKMESPSMAELERDGYVPKHERNVELERNSEVPEGVSPVGTRKPHQLHSSFFSRIQTGVSTEFTLKVWTTIQLLEQRVQRKLPDFQSPLKKAKLASWAEHAHKLKLASTGQDATSLLVQLEVWYTALRLLALSWEEDEQLVLQWLNMSNGFAGDSSPEMTELQRMAESPENFFKLGRLHHHLTEKREIKGDAFRCIIFVQQRITSVVLSHFINNDRELKRIGLKSGFVAARESKITPMIKVTKEMVKNTIESFRSGELNVIVATSVIEEGFDVPAANVVISFDHLKDSVELCQRFGRARQNDSSIVVLDERPDRPLSLLENVRELQDSIVQQYNPTSMHIDEGSEKSKQRDRERQAQPVLQGVTLEKALASVNLYVKKTKASLAESFQHNGNRMVCSLTYRSVLRSIKVDGEAPSQKVSKKAAKKIAALALIKVLQHHTKN